MGLVARWKRVLERRAGDLETYGRNLAISVKKKKICRLQITESSQNHLKLAKRKERILF